MSRRALQVYRDEGYQDIINVRFPLAIRYIFFLFSVVLFSFVASCLKDYVFQSTHHSEI